MRSRIEPIEVRGEKIVLREKRISDAMKDYSWSTDKELSELDAASPMKLSFQQALMLYEEEMNYPTSRRQRFAIDTVEGEHIGNCMFYDVNEARGEAELGIMIGDRRYWSKAYGADAVRTLLRYIFTTTKLHRVYLHTLDWNIRAQKSFAKVGFAPIGPVKRHGLRFIAMDIHRQDWEKEELGGPSSGAQANGTAPTKPPVS